MMENNNWDISLEDISEMIKGEYKWLLDCVPCFGQLYKVANSIVAIRDKIIIKKTILFFEKIKRTRDDINPFEVEKRKNAIKEKEKWIAKELEQLIIYIDRYEDDRKIPILAGLYIKILNGQIDWETFLEMSAMLDRVFYLDLLYLVELQKEWEKPENRTRLIKDTVGYNHIRCERLLSSGFLSKRIAFSFTGESFYEMTESGETFCEVINSI